MPPVQPPDDQPTKPKSALDIVVNQLVRASVGGNIPSSLSDEDLDKYVADLIMKEASAKNKLYNKEGIRAYLPHTETPQCNLPKTNKRFLLNVIKSVDGHNQALIKKSEEDAAAARMRNFRRLERLHRRRSSKRRHRDSDRSSRRRSRRDKSRYADHFSSSRYSDSDYSEEEISRS
ncbi:2662_t:CDS:2, partial [Racocetra persica]